MSRPAPATHPVDQPLPPELLPLVRALARMAARRQLAAAQTPEPSR